MTYHFAVVHPVVPCYVVPAMEAGVTDRLWSVEDLVALWEAYEERRTGRAA